VIYGPSGSNTTAPTARSIAAIKDVTLDGLSQTRHHAQACVVYGYRFWIIAGKHDRRDLYSSGEEIVLQLDACHRGHVGINQQAIGVWAAVVERGEELMA
jgi:hypothetical protein